MRHRRAIVKQNVLIFVIITRSSLLILCHYEPQIPGFYFNRFGFAAPEKFVYIVSLLTEYRLTCRSFHCQAPKKSGKSKKHNNYLQSLFSPIMELEFPPEKPSEKLIEAQSALKEKGYAFSLAKKLCQVINGSIQEDSKFVFEVKKDDRAYNQKNYEEIGDIITEFVYGLLESSPICLKRRDIPPASSGSKDIPRSFVYVSENFDSCDKLCVIIHGSGVVRAGQWVCIPSSLLADMAAFGT